MKLQFVISSEVPKEEDLKHWEKGCQRWALDVNVAEHMKYNSM